MNASKIIFSVLLLFVALAAPVHALVGPDVRPVTATFDKDLTPGTDADLAVNLTNVGVFNCAYLVQTQVQLATPLSVSGLDSKRVDSICKPDTATVHFAVHVDASAQAGSYPITLSTTYESEYRAQYTTTNTVYARVLGTPNLAAHVTGTRPVSVYGGDDFSIDVAVDNVGAFRADSLTLTLVSAETPLEIKSTARTQSAATLSPRASVTKTFELHAPENAAAKPYGLMLQARYLDDKSQWVDQTLPLSVSVDPRAHFQAHDGERAAWVDSRNNPVTYIVTNDGSQTAKRVRVKLLPAFPFSTQGTVQYLETLQPGESQTMTFYADVDKEGTPGTYALDLSVSFENPDGDSFTQTVPVSAKVEYTPLFDAIFVNYWYLWVLAAIVAFVMVRKRQAAAKPAKSK